MWPAYDFTVPENKRFRYICHTDAKNEADDQFTIAHVLMTDKLRNDPGLSPDECTA